MSNTNKKLAVVVATKNNMRTIAECLDSVAGLYDGLVIVDSGSTDNTKEFCIEKGAVVIEREWPGMVKQRQYCLDACSDYEWILVLDSDESIDEILFNSITEVIKGSGDQYDAYEFNRKVWFLGGWLHNAFQPEFRLRLVRGGAGAVTGAGVDGQGGHDRIEVPGKIGRLEGTCKHDSWIDVEDMMKRYIELGRRAAEFDGKPSNPRQLVLSPLWAFIKQFFLKKGYRDGLRGLMVSLAFSCGMLIKHLLKNEKQYFSDCRKDISLNKPADASGKGH